MSIFTEEEDKGGSESVFNDVNDPEPGKKKFEPLFPDAKTSDKLVSPFSLLQPISPFSQKYPGFENLSVPDSKELQSASNPFLLKVFRDDYKPDLIKEGANNSILSKKVLKKNPKTGEDELVDWDMEGFSDSPMAFLGYGGVLYSRPVEGQSKGPASYLDSRGNMFDSTIADAIRGYDKSQVYELMVPSFSKDGTPYLRMIRSTMEEAEKNGYNILNKFGLPEDSSNFAASFLKSGINTLGQTDDIILGASKFVQDGFRLLGGSDFKENTWLDNLHEAATLNTKYRDMLLSKEADEFGTWDWFGSGMGSAIASLTQFGGIGRGIRYGSMGIKKGLELFGKSAATKAEKTMVTDIAKRSVIDKVSTYGASGVVSFGHAYNDALQNGLPTADAWVYGALVGSVMASIESYLGASFDKFLTGGGYQAVRKELKKEILESGMEVDVAARSWMKSRGKDFVESFSGRIKNMASEGAEEVLQDISEQSAKIIYNDFIKDNSQFGFADQDEYSIQQTLSAGLFGAIAAMPFKAMRPTMVQRILNGESEQVGIALDQLYANNEISKITYDKMRKDKARVEQIFSLNKDILDNAREDVKAPIFKDIASLIEQKIDLEDANRSLEESLGKKDLSEVKDAADQVKKKLDSNNEKLKKVNEKLESYKNPDFLNKQVKDYGERIDMLRNKSNELFKLINEKLPSDFSQNQDEFLKRTGTLKAENFIESRLARTPEEAIFAIQALANKQIDPSLKDILGRDIMENFLYLSPIMNENENARKEMLSLGVTEDMLPLNSKEKAEAAKDPAKFKGRYLTFDQFNQILSSVTDEQITEFYKNNSPANVQSKYNGHDRMMYLLNNKKAFGINDAMLASLDNRQEIKRLFTPQQQAVLDKLFKSTLPHNLLIADGLSSGPTGAFDNQNRFMFVSSSIGDLLSSTRQPNKNERKKLDDLFKVIVHETGHAMFDRELDRMFDSWAAVKTGNSKFLNGDYHLFERLYRLAVLSDDALSDNSSYAKSYFRQIAEGHNNSATLKAKIESSLTLVKEFYAEALSNPDFQKLLDSFDINSPKNKKKLQSSSYFYAAPEGKKESLLAQVLEAVSSVFTRFKNLFSRQERTLLTEAFIAGSAINYNVFVPVGDLTRLKNKSISLFDPINVFEEGEIVDISQLSMSLLSRLERREIKITPEEREALYKSIVEFVDSEIVGEDSDEYVKGSAMVIFFKNTEDFMISWRSFDGTDNGPDSYKYNRAFFGKNGNRRYINTDVDNHFSPTSLSKTKYQNAFADLNDMAWEADRQMANAYDKAEKEDFRGETFLEYDESHSFVLNGQEIAGSVKIMYTFPDGQVKAIGYVPDLLKVRLSQILSEGNQIKISVKTNGVGSPAFVKRNDDGDIVDIRDDLNDVDASEYMEERVLPSATFTYLPGTNVSDSLKQFIDEADSLTPDTPGLRPRGNAKELITGRDILLSGKTRKFKSSISLYNPDSSNRDKLVPAEPRRRDEAIQYIQSGLIRSLRREMTWGVEQEELNERNFEFRRYTDDAIREMANEYARQGSIYLNGIFGDDPTFKNLGFESRIEYADFVERVIGDIRNEFTSSSDVYQEDWNGMGGDPAGKISFAIRADLDSINYEFEGSKYWMTYSQAKNFLFEAAQGTSNFDDMANNLKAMIDSRQFGGVLLARARAIHEYLTKDRNPDSAEGKLFELAKKTYWSQFGSMIRLDAATIHATKDGSAILYMNGEKTALRQKVNELAFFMKQKIDLLKIEAQSKKLDPVKYYKDQLNEFYVENYSNELVEREGITKQQAVVIARNNLVTQGNKQSDVISMLGSWSSRYGADAFRGEKMYSHSSGGNSNYATMSSLAKYYYKFLGVSIPEKLFMFQPNRTLYNSIESRREELFKQGFNPSQIDNTIKIELAESKASYNDFIEVQFKDSKTKLLDNFPFIMLAMQSATLSSFEIVRDLKNEKADYKTSLMSPLAKAITQLDGTYRTPEFYFNAKFEKEWAYKTRSYLDTIVQRLSNKKDPLMGKYLASDLYKNNRFLQSIKESGNESVQLMLSGLTDGNRNGKSYNDAIQMDYLYMNLGTFLFNYDSAFYYHIDDVPSDKPRNMAFRMLRMKVDNLESEVQKIIDMESVRLKQFESRFSKAFKENKNGTYSIKNQKEFDLLPKGPLYKVNNDGTYSKGWGFDKENNFYLGKSASEVRAEIMKEAKESFSKWNSKMEIPVTEKFLRNLANSNTFSRQQSLTAERERIFTEWYVNNVINRYHISQVTMGDNIYYNPKGLLDLSKRHAGTSAPSSRGLFNRPQLKVSIFDDIKQPTDLPLVRMNADGQWEIDYENTNNGKVVDTTDAQGYVTEEFAKEITDAYGAFSPFEKVFKPVLFGMNEDKIKDGQPIYLKLSMAILPNPNKPENRSFYDAQPGMETFARKLYASGSDFGLFGTGVKVGAYSVNDVNAESFKTINVDSNLFGVQNNPYHDPNSDDNYINGAVQMTKQLGDNGNAETMAKYHAIEGNLIRNSIQEFFQNVFSDKYALREAIRKNLSKNEWSNPLLNFLDSDFNVLDNAITATMAENIVNSSFRKSSSLSRKDGEKLVNMSNFGIGRPEMSESDKARRSELLAQLNLPSLDYDRSLRWSGPRKPQDLTLFQLESLVERIGKNGEINFINPQGYIMDDDGNIQIYPTEALAPEGENYKVGDKIIALRIPTSKKSNVIPSVVVGYTSPAQGNVIVVSEHGPSVLGFDFDVDGLFVWRERQSDENTDLKDMFNIAYSILNDVKNYNETISPVVTDNLNELKNKINELKANRNSGFTFSKWSPERQLELKTLNSIGKDMISAAASYSGIHSILSQTPNRAPFISGNFSNRFYRYKGQALFRFETESVINGQKILISDIFSEFINAATDNAKLQLLGQLGLNPYLSGVVFDMISHGIPMDYAIMFVNQPSIQYLSSRTDLKNAASFMGDRNEDSFLHTQNLIEQQIRKLGGKYADYTFPESKSVYSYKVVEDEVVIATEDKVELSIEALESGIEGTTRGIGDPIDLEFAKLENQLIALDKFKYYNSLSSITKKAGRLVTLTSTFPKTFIELVKRIEEIKDAGIVLFDEEGNLLKDRKIDIDHLLNEHGTYSVLWQSMNDLRSAYSAHKFYAVPQIIENHIELAGQKSADLQQSVMEDFYTYVLQFSEESDNDNFKYNLSTSSLFGHRIDPYYFVHQSANVIKALMDAYPENEFLSILAFKQNIKSEKQAEDKARKPNQIQANLFFEPDADMLARIRQGFLSLPKDLRITLDGVPHVIPSVQDVLLGHILHTQGFRMGGLSYSKLLPIEVVTFIDSVVQNWADDATMNNLQDDLKSFNKQAKLNHPELARVISKEKLERVTQSEVKHFETWSQETTDSDAIYEGVMKRKTLPDGGEEISIMSRRKNLPLTHMLNSMIDEGYVKIQDSSGKLRMYEVSKGFIPEEVGGYRVAHVIMKTVNFIPYNNVKNYGEDIFYNNLSNRTLELNSYASDEWDTGEVAPDPIETFPFAAAVDSEVVSYEDIQNGDRKAITLNLMPEVQVGDIVRIQTDKGPVSVRITSAPYSLSEMYNKLVSNNMNEGERLIADEDIARFVAMVRKDGKKPDSYFTFQSTFKQFYNNEKGVREKAPDNTRWQLNDLGLYDLVDLETGETYYENVNMATGRVMVPKDGGSEYLREQFVARWAELEGKDKNEFQFNDLMNKFQVKLASVEPVQKAGVDISSSTAQSPFFEKDKAKFARASKLISRGSSRSSSEAYRIAAGDKANTGSYAEGDIVGISAEGNRSGRVAPDFAEIQKAIDAGATFITDTEADREREYNIGEREVADFLTENGYREVNDGVWKKVANNQVVQFVLPDAIRERIERAIGKINLNPVLSEADKSDFITKLNSATTMQDIDAVANELMTKCKS
jgi:hypothetical protein